MQDHSHGTPWILSCEAMKTGADVQERYELRVAVLLESHQQLDEMMTTLLMYSCYLCIFSDEIKPIVHYLEDAEFYDQVAIELSQQVSKKNPIVFQKIRLISSESLLTDKQFLTFTEHDIPPLPEQDHLPFWEKQWITDELKAQLFADPDSKAPLLRTYLIIDGGLYSDRTGFYYFSDSITDVQIACMYTGEAAENLKHVAPYLIDVTLSKDADKYSILDFHNRYFEKCWGQNVGVFIRTTATFEEVHKHFRKFMRAMDEETGKWCFFRFHDPRVVVDYFQSINDWAERCKLFMSSRDNSLSFSILSEQDDGKKLVCIEPNQLLADFSGAIPLFAITARDKAGLKKRELRKKCHLITKELKMLFPKELENSEDIEQLVFNSVTRMRNYGFTSGEYLFQLVAFEIFYGKEYEVQENSGELVKICHSDLDETSKFNEFMEHMTQLTFIEEANEYE